LSVVVDVAIEPGEALAAIEALQAAGADGIELGPEDRRAYGLFVAADDLPAALVAELTRVLGRAPVIAVRRAEALDWGSSFRLAPGPRRVGPLAIARPGEEAAQPRIILDDLGAFGSGLHPTTAMCLERIVELSPISSLLDVGTGTGILALAALILGAGDAAATDLDPAAIASARANAARNHLADALRLSSELPPGQFSVVAANIAAAELIELAPAIVQRLESKGAVILSGIRPEQGDEVARSYQRLGLAAPVVFERGGWLRLELVAGW
jgi:ribosomal protein L11 methyltransferase